MDDPLLGFRDFNFFNATFCLLGFEDFNFFGREEFPSQAVWMKPCYYYILTEEKQLIDHSCTKSTFSQVLLVSRRTRVSLGMTQVESSKL